jgi:acyl-CoA thioester hydrolase
VAGKEIEQKNLVSNTNVRVRFKEVDSLGIVWHGHYVQFFEDGREAFGQEFGLEYLDVYHAGFVTPIVSIQCDYKRSLRYGDTVNITTKYIPTDAAKLKFQYRLTNAQTGEVVATGSSVQVFLERASGDLSLTNPTFFEEWKAKHGII